MYRTIHIYEVNTVAGNFNKKHIEKTGEITSITVDILQDYCFTIVIFALQAVVVSTMAFLYVKMKNK